MNRKGQFYLITLVFVATSLFIVLMFTQFVEFGSLTLTEPQADFGNLQNAIAQRNAWLPTYWFDLRWRTRTIVNITGNVTNPVEIDANIIGDCDNTVRVFNKSGLQFIEIQSNVTNASSPCNVVFNAVPGRYEIYWNSTVSIPNKNISSGNTPTYTKTVQQVPQEGICSYYNNILPKRGVSFGCIGTAGINTYNYSVNFTSTDFTFSGTLE